MAQVVDTLTLYTLENGFLTWCVRPVAEVCKLRLISIWRPLLKRDDHGLLDLCTYAIYFVFRFVLRYPDPILM